MNYKNSTLELHNIHAKKKNHVYINMKIREPGQVGLDIRAG